jgi:hypothetical protein
MDTPGVVASKILTDEERKLVSILESEATVGDQLVGIKIINEGIRDVLSRDHVIVISHSRLLRHPPGPTLVLCDRDSLIGEEVWEPDRIANVSQDPNVIWLGRNMIIYRDAIARARGRPLTFCYRALAFPELDEVEGIRDVVSVTIGSLTHLRLSQEIGWNYDNPDLGTVLIGFNSAYS